MSHASEWLGRRDAWFKCITGRCALRGGDGMARGTESLARCLGGCEKKRDPILLFNSQRTIVRARWYLGRTFSDLSSIEERHSIFRDDISMSNVQQLHRCCHVNLQTIAMSRRARRLSHVPSLLAPSLSSHSSSCLEAKPICLTGQWAVSYLSHTHVSPTPSPCLALVVCLCRGYIFTASNVPYMLPPSLSKPTNQNKKRLRKKGRGDDDDVHLAFIHTLPPRLRSLPIQRQRHILHLLPHLLQKIMAQPPTPQLVRLGG
jgi:hypothetical protein